MNSSTIALVLCLIFTSQAFSEEIADKSSVNKQKAISIKVHDKEYILDNYVDGKKFIQPFHFDDTAEKCNKSGFLKKDRQNTIELNKIETNDKVKYFIINEKHKYSGIRSVNYSVNKIVISLNNFQGFDAYESLTNKTVKKISYKGSLAESALIHTFSFGIGLVLAPKNSYDQAFGCTDNFVINREIDRSRQENKLPETVWRQVNYKHSFKIKSSEFEFDSDDNNDKKLINQTENKVEIDLSSKLKPHLQNSPVNINIICTSCSNLTEAHQNIFGVANINLETVVTLNYIKSDLEIAEEKKLEIIKREFDEKLATKEGSICAAKAQPTLNNKIFTNCFNDELEKTALLKKYNDAVISKEGIDCSKKFKINNSKFWSCYEKNVSETNIKIQQIIDKENEAQRKKNEFANFLKSDDIARQCIDIGFEISTPPYRDCYLKLKLHTEQILEWQKLQTSIQSQINQISQNQSIRIKSESAVDSGVNYDQAEALFGIAQRSLDMGSGRNRSALPILPLKPPPMRIITPQGNSYNCSMMGAAMRCR